MILVPSSEKLGKTCTMRVEIYVLDCRRIRYSIYCGSSNMQFIKQGLGFVGVEMYVGLMKNHRVGRNLESSF